MKRETLLKVLDALPQSIRMKVTRSYVKSKIKKMADLQVEGYESIKDIEGPVIFICNQMCIRDRCMRLKVSYTFFYYANIKKIEISCKIYYN